MKAFLIAAVAVAISGAAFAKDLKMDKERIPLPMDGNTSVASGMVSVAEKGHSGIPIKRNTSVTSGRAKKMAKARIRFPMERNTSASSQMG